MKVQYILYLILISSLLVLSLACEHEPILLPEDGMSIDTTDMSIDTMDIDTSTTLVPCDPDLVYFDLQVLPILQSNCAFSGCHDADSAQDGVILDNYENVMATADVEAYDLTHSELYTVLIDDDDDQRMPPTPSEQLNQSHIQLIAKWILQGAKDLDCDLDAEGCDTEDVRFSTIVQPLIQTYCEGCHSGQVPSGGIFLTTYEHIKTVVDNGRLWGAINWEDGFVNMPLGGDQLDECTLDQIKSWIDSGALNN